MNVAGADAKKNGISADVLMQQNRSWVLSRLSVELDRQPEQYEEYDVATWVNPHSSRFISTRNFEISDKSGNIYGRALSQWCVIDFVRRMPVVLEEVEGRHFQAESVIVGYILQSNHAEKQILFSVCMSDIAN